MPLADVLCARRCAERRPSSTSPQSGQPPHATRSSRSCTRASLPTSSHASMASARTTARTAALTAREPGARWACWTCTASSALLSTPSSSSASTLPTRSCSNSSSRASLRRRRALIFLYFSTLSCPPRSRPPSASLLPNLPSLGRARAGEPLRARGRRLPEHPLRGQRRDRARHRGGTARSLPNPRCAREDRRFHPHHLPSPDCPSVLPY